MQCSVFNCSNQTDNAKYQFFQFPKAKKLINKWLNFCNQSNKINIKLARVCSKHFKPNQLLRNSKGKIIGLKPNVVPLIKFSEKNKTKASSLQLIEDPTIDNMYKNEGNDLTTTLNACNSSRYMQKCRGHNEFIKYVCEDCRTLLCEICIPEMHNGHNWFDIHNFLNHRRDLVHNLLKIGKMASLCSKSILSKEVEYARHIDNNCNMLAQSVRNTFRPLISALEQRENCLLDFVHKMHKNRIECMYEQINAIKTSYSGFITSTNKIIELFEDGYKLENLYFITKLLEVQREVDMYGALYREKQHKKEVYKFVSPQFPENILKDIENLGLIELDKDTHTNIIDISDLFQDVIGQDTEFTSLHTLAFADEAQPKKEIRANIAIGQAIAGSYEKVKVLHSDVPTLTIAPKRNGNNSFGRPWGVCVNKLGHILITDRRNHNVQVLDANGQFKYKFGQKGSSGGEFNAPSGICVDKNSRIIIADKNNHRIQVFASGGIHILSFGSFGSECGNFKFPYDVSVNSILQIVVTDTANHRIQQFESNGSFIREIPLGICKFTGYDITPRGICYTPKGNIIITDYTNHCLHLIDPAKEEIIRTKGNQGFGYLQFSYPSGVCCDDNGTIIVADSHNHRICVFSLTLEGLWNIDIRPSVNGLTNTYCDETDRTCDVALTKDGRIVFVSEMLLANETSNTTKKFVHVY